MMKNNEIRCPRQQDYVFNSKPSSCKDSLQSLTAFGIDRQNARLAF